MPIRLGLLPLLFLVSRSYSETTVLRLCNENADRRVFVARMTDFGGSSGWQASGWYPVEKSQCRDLALGTYNGKVYLYADDEFHETYWGEGDTTFCINQTSAFNIPHADTAACTDTGQKRVRSDEIAVAGGTTVWTFKPNISKINFCNKNEKIGVYVSTAGKAETNWNSKGWYLVKPQLCEQVTLGRYKGDVRFYGEYNGGEYTWGTGPEKFCVNRTNAFQHSNAEDPALCTGADVKMVLASTVAVDVGITEVALDAVALKTTLRLCNKTPDLVIRTAYGVERAGPILSSKGWVELNPSQCKETDLASYVGTTYLYAEAAGGTVFWGNGPVNFCVNKNTDFSINDAGNSAVCKEDPAQKMVPTTNFAVVHGVNEFSFIN